MRRSNDSWKTLVQYLAGSSGLLLFQSSVAQTSPFTTGANALVTFALTIGTPIAVLIVIGVGIAAAARLMSWGWAIGVIAGIALIFGSSQIVTWVRGMFGV